MAPSPAVTDAPKAGSLGAKAPKLRLPDAPTTAKQDRARLAALGSNPQLQDLMQGGFDRRVLEVRDGAAGFTTDERPQVFGQIASLDGAQRRALRDVLVFKPPHPLLAKMDRKHPALIGPPTAQALMQLLSGELWGQAPACSPYHHERVDQVMRAFGEGRAEADSWRSLMLSHDSVLRLAERNGPAAFELVAQFGADGLDALLADGFHSSELVEVALAQPERIKEARRFLDAEGPKAFGAALDALYDLKFGSNVSTSQAILQLGFAPAAEAAQLLGANKHGVSAFKALYPQENLLDLAARGPRVLAERIEQAGAQVVEFGSGGVPLMRGTTKWPPLQAPQTPKVAAAERRLLQALGLDLEVLDNPQTASVQDLSRVIRAMRQQIQAANPESSQTLTRELAGRRFISKKYYDTLYSQGTGNPEHRYSKATYTSWREGEAFVRAQVKADQGRPLTPNRVLEVISGIHARVGQGMVQVHESHLRTSDLGQLRQTDAQHVQLGNHLQRLDTAKDKILAQNPYLQPTESFDNGDGVSRHVAFSKGSDVPRLMDETAQWIVDNEGKLAPEDLAAEAHFRLVSIHPFMDGNGRSCKLMVDYLLRRAGVEPPVWRQGDILLKQDTWADAIKEGVAFHLDTVQRYFRATVDPAPQSEAGA